MHGPCLMESHRLTDHPHVLYPQGQSHKWSAIFNSNHPLFINMISYVKLMMPRLVVKLRPLASEASVLLPVPYYYNNNIIFRSNLKRKIVALKLISLSEHIYHIHIVHRTTFIKRCHQLDTTIPRTPCTKQTIGNMSKWVPINLRVMLSQEAKSRLMAAKMLPRPSHSIASATRLLP